MIYWVAIHCGRVITAMNILTDELLSKMMLEPSLDEVLKHTTSTRLTLAEYLDVLLREKTLKKSVVIAESQLNQTFAYQIFSGERNPSRNKLLQLAFAMRLDFHETKRLLRCANVGELYIKNRRDAIIIFCLNNGLSLIQTEEKLYAFGEETIVSA